jgi:orotidine-5'-phosphate decarboxylase
MERFGARLRRAVDERGPLCVGIDPHPSLLASWGLPDDVDGLNRFAETAVEAFAGQVAAVKPQSAFFERHGSRGVAILESIIRQLAERETLVILDVKRGDIGSTAAAYADAYLDPASPLAADAITVSPYVGVGALRPIVDTALDGGRGVFILALTSNPEGGTVQLARIDDGRTVAQAVVDEISLVNAGVEPLGDIGAVVGATIAPGSIDLTKINGPILVPGLGAQGGRPDELPAVLALSGATLLPSYSREVLREGPDVAALRAAAARARDACVRALTIQA